MVLYIIYDLNRKIFQNFLDCRSKSGRRPENPVVKLSCGITRLFFLTRNTKTDLLFADGQTMVFVLPMGKRSVYEFVLYGVCYGTTES